MDVAKFHCAIKWHNTTLVNGVQWPSCCHKSMMFMTHVERKFMSGQSYCYFGRIVWERHLSDPLVVSLIKWCLDANIIRNLADDITSSRVGWTRNYDNSQFVERYNIRMFVLPCLLRKVVGILSYCRTTFQPMRLNTIIVCFGELIYSGLLVSVGEEHLSPPWRPQMESSTGQTTSSLPSPSPCPWWWEPS